MTYWIYQHLGNLSPSALAEDETYAKVRESRDDAGPVLRDYARRAYEDREGIRWSYRRDLCDTRVIVMDSRGGRVLEEGRRSIFDEEEREWVWGQAEGDFDHLLIATSDPFLLSHGLHHLEAWSEAVCDGAWGGAGGSADREASAGRGLRPLGVLRALLPAPLRPAARGRILDGAHPSRLDRRPRGRRPPCLPGRGWLPAWQRRPKPRLPGGLLAVSQSARQARAPRHPGAVSKGRGGAHEGARARRRRGPPEIGWRFLEGPYFDNQVASLTLDGRSARIKLEKTQPGETEERSLETSFERRLA